MWRGFWGKKNCIDPVDNLLDDKVFLFHGTKDECYKMGAMDNTADFYAMLVSHPDRQIKFNNTQPFPHTLPTNSTPYAGQTKPAGYDGPGECFKWLYGTPEKPLNAAVAIKPTHNVIFDATPFLDDYTINIRDTGLMYIPDGCLATGKQEVEGANEGCALHIYIPAFTGDDAPEAYKNWAESNRIVLLVPRNTNPNNVTANHVNANEISRGGWDTYGQLSPDYALQTAPHMRFVGNILKALLAQRHATKEPLASTSVFV